MEKKTLKEAWKKYSPANKSATAATFILSAAVIVLAVLQLTGVWDKAINVFEPLLGALMLIQAAQNWKKNRTAAVLCLVGAIFVFIAGILILLGTLLG